MSAFSRNRKKNFGFHRKILKLKRLREANFPHVIAKKKKSRKYKELHFPIKFKNYNSLYNQSPKKLKKDNKGYCNGGGGNHRHDHHYNTNHREFCTDCNHSQNNMNTRCTQCGSENIITLHIDARVPRKKANKKTWGNFRKLFVNYKLKILNSDK